MGEWNPDDAKISPKRASAGDLPTAVSALFLCPPTSMMPPENDATDFREGTGDPTLVSANEDLR